MNVENNQEHSKADPFVEELTDQDGQKPAIGIYILPNLFTTASLFAGFYAIIASISGLFEIAAIATFIAMISDSLDGRLARLTHTQSAFGAEYDSLSDMVAFGLGPAIIIFEWSLQYLGKIGWLAAFIYVAAVALRLARFNAQQGNLDKRYFKGLPCPAAAGALAGLVWLGSATRAGDFIPSLFVTLLTIGLAVAMISNMRYRSFKDLDFKNRAPFVAILFIILIFVGIALKPDLVLFFVFFGYSLSGFINWLHPNVWFKREKEKAVDGQNEQ